MLDNSSTRVDSLPRLLRLAVELGGKKAVALIDTGAGVSLVSARLFSLLKAKYVTKLDDRVTIHNASGQPMNVSGRFRIPIRIHSEVMTAHPFVVSSSLAEDLILGLDFMIAHKLGINGADRTITCARNGGNLVLVASVETRMLDTSSFDLKHLRTSNVSASQEKRLVELLTRNRGLIANTSAELGRCSVVRHEINTVVAPPRCRPCQIPITLGDGYLTAERI